MIHLGWWNGEGGSAGERLVKCTVVPARVAVAMSAARCWSPPTGRLRTEVACRILNLSGCDSKQPIRAVGALIVGAVDADKNCEVMRFEWQTKKSNLAINRPRQRCGQECERRLRTARRFRVTIRIFPSLPRNHPPRLRPRATCRSGSMSRHGADRLTVSLLLPGGENAATASRKRNSQSFSKRPAYADNAPSVVAAQIGARGRSHVPAADATTISGTGPLGRITSSREMLPFTAPGENKAVRSQTNAHVLDRIQTSVAKHENASANDCPCGSIRWRKHSKNSPYRERAGWSSPPEIVFETNDVILTEIASGLDLDQLERDLARVSQAMDRAERHIDQLVLLQQ